MSKKEDGLDELYDNLDEVYQITLRGLIWTVVEDDKLSKEIVDKIELYLRRHHAKGGHPGIVFNMDDNNFEFVTLQQSE